jgi:hypothetical protein
VVSNGGSRDISNNRTALGEYWAIRCKKLVVRAEIFPECDGGKCEFDYIDETDELNFLILMVELWEI